MEAIKMEKRFKFSLNRAKKLLEFKVWGFWDEEEYNAFFEEVEDNINRLSSMGTGFYVLVDTTEYPAQIPEVQEGMKKTMGYMIKKVTRDTKDELQKESPTTQLTTETDKKDDTVEKNAFLTLEDIKSQDSEEAFSVFFLADGPVQKHKYFFRLYPSFSIYS